MNTPRDSDMDQDENSAAASFAHSLAVAPLDTANTIHNISVALGNGDALSSGAASNSSADGVDVLMTDVTAAVQSNIAAMEQQSQLQPAESRMAVAELLVSLGQNTHGPAQGAGASAHASSGTGHLPMKQQSPIYRNAVDYVGSVKKAYENNPKVYTEFLTALEQYHGTSLQIDQLVRTVMGLFQDQPDLLLGFKEFLPEAQGLMNQLVPPMMYSDYKGNAAKSPVAAQQNSPVSGTPQGTQQEGNINSILNNGHAAADFLSLIKEKSQQEPDMYQHLITLLRKFQKEHSYANLYFYVSIILRYHPHLLQRFHKFLPSVASDAEVTEPRFISKAPPEELVVSPDFIEAKDFVQTVKFAAKNDMSMYDRFIFALEKYQRNGWTIDQVYSEVSLIFWNHPDALAGFKLFISSVPPPSQP
ncbi:Paired amphipathic helix protein Sin3b [Mortierella antarctica]|nr:Paired amphipathic helix protein Sin3b [Mortierella alpina]KAF9984014.1 Paired amphipathic helix protein Sin3b [Mortierella antarctica]